MAVIAAGAAEVRRRHCAFPAGRARRQRPRSIPRSVSRTLRRAAARRLRLDRNEFRVRRLHPVRSPRHDGPSVEGVEACHRWSADDAPLLTVRPASCCCARASRSHSRRAISSMPDKTAEAWRNLWFHTGDRVVRDADGHYRFVDRMKDSIRRRGENVSSWEVEQVLLKHPANRCLRRLSAAVRAQARTKVAGATVQLRTRPCAGADRCRPGIARARWPISRFRGFVRIVAEYSVDRERQIGRVALREAGRTSDTWDRDAARGYKRLRR